VTVTAVIVSLMKDFKYWIKIGLAIVIAFFVGHFLGYSITDWFLNLL
tara:strand:- start:318 stop:458 length:141 start_codon:yes stop_codon:yes gene_type:complete